MNYKRIIGVIVLVIGVVLIIFAADAMKRISSAKNAVSGASGFMPNNPAGNMVTGSMEKAASQYDVPVMICLIGGIVLVLVGGGMAIFCRKK